MYKYDIQEILIEKHHLFTNDILSLSEKDFLYAPPGKWTAGQQLEHIYKSIAPVRLAVALPKFLLRLLFGKANRPSRDYNTLVNKYQQKLQAGGKAPVPFIPKPVLFIQKENLQNKIVQNIKKINDSLHKYTETELDLYILPHPLLGKLTLREMLYFTMYHVEHHHRAALHHLEP